MPLDPGRAHRDRVGAREARAGRLSSRSGAPGARAKVIVPHARRRACSAAPVPDRGPAPTAAPVTSAGASRDLVASKAPGWVLLGVGGAASSGARSSGRCAAARLDARRRMRPERTALPLERRERHLERQDVRRARHRPLRRGGRVRARRRLLAPALRGARRRGDRAAGPRARTARRGATAPGFVLEPVTRRSCT